MKRVDASGKEILGRHMPAADQQANGSPPAELAAQHRVTAAHHAPLRADAVRVQPGPDGIVTLPAGVSLDDIHVVGRDLVVQLPDGTQMVVVDGAVFVPELVVGGVEIPPVNLAALLIGEEPRPAAGPPQSSGGNFEVPVGTIGDGLGLGNLLPPTELAFTTPEFREIFPAPASDNPPDVIIITPDVPSGAMDVTASVAEAGLPARGNEPAGSNAAASSETTSGSIVFNPGDLPSVITINGTAVTAAGQTFTTPLGVLTITSIGTNSIGYSYTLTDNSIGDSSPDRFTVVVTDRDGDTAQGTLTVNIADDVPTARPDTDSIPAGTYGPATGNVVTGTGTTSGAAGVDTPGADGATVTGIHAGATGAFTTVGAGGATVSGQYGVLTIAADGSYSYVRNAGTPGGVTDSFTYRFTDGDGDNSTTTLSIAIGDSGTVTTTPSSGEGTIVDEAGLPARGNEPAGSAVGSSSETTMGTITYNAPDGPASITINGVAVTTVGQTVTTPVGTLTITSIADGAIGYNYTLTDNTSGNNASDTFTVVVTDVDGDSSSAPLTITIVDDVPTAVNDIATQGAENQPVVINAFANDIFGADGVDTDNNPNVAVTFTQPASGTVAYDPATGLFTFTPAPGQQGSDSFTYTITDGDGDSSTATVTVNLVADSVPTIEPASATVSEAGLPAGSNASANSETATGILNVATGGDTVNSLVINGVNVSGGGTVTGASGTLTVTLADGHYNYSYTLTSATSGDATTDQFQVVVTDSDGDSASSTLTVHIVDDVPTAIADADSVTEDGPLAADGNVIVGVGGSDANVTDGVADVQGADGAHVTAVAFGQTDGTVGSALAGAYGELTLNADGSYSYALNNDSQPVQGLSAGQTLTETFSYTITDGDGDHSSTTLTITIKGADDPVTITGLSGDGAEETVFENDLVDGSSPNAAALAQTGTFAISTVDGLGDVTVGGTLVVSNGVFTSGLSATSATGAVTITGFTPLIGADGSTIGGTFSYSYTLADNTLAHSAAGADSLLDSFAVQVTDSDGSSATASLDIAIIDDLPAANADIGNVVEGSTLNVSATGVLANDIAGADGFAAGGGVVGVRAAGSDLTSAVATGVDSAIKGLFGTLTLHADGSYSYASTANSVPVAGAEDVFVYTVRDGDGDQSTTTLTISVADSGLAATNEDVSVNEAALAIGSNPTSTAETVTGTLADNVTGGAGSNSFALTGSGTGTYGTLSLDPSGSYSYTLTKPFTTTPAADDGTTPANNADTFTYQVTDGDGNTTTNTITIDIIDDVPSVSVTGAIAALTVDETVLTTDASASFASVFTPVFGADGAGSTSYALGVVAGASGLTDVATGEAVNLSLVSGEVQGRTASTNQLVFTVDVDAATGLVTLDQLRAVAHTPNTGPDQSTGLAAADLITLTATVTDGDGDKASATANIGGALTFKDDAPSIDASVTDANTVLLTTHDALTIGAASDGATSTANFGGAFTIASSSYGADGAGTTAWGYTLSVANATSGLSSDGAAIKLYLIGTDVVGSTAASAGAVTAGNTIFSLSVAASTGVVTLTQFAEIDHSPNNDTSAPYDDQFAILGNGLINLNGTATITDRDGDPASETVSLDLGGNIRFADDGPSIDASVTDANTVLLTTHDALTTGTASDTDVSTANFGGAFTIASSSYGADGAGTTAWSYALSVANATSGLASNGAAINLYLIGGDVVGSTAGSAGAVTTANTIFSLSVAASTGVVTLTQFAEIDHAPNNDTSAPYDDQFAILGAGLVNLNGTATITDGDGDKASETVSLDLGGNVRFADDGPAIDASVTDANAVLLTTHDALTIGASSDSATSTANFGGAFSIASSSYGADGAGTTAWNYTLSVANAVSGLSSDGAAINLYLIGNDVVGSTAGSAGAVTTANTIFSLSVAATTGVVTLTQFAEIDHAPNNDTSAPYDDQFAILGTGLVNLNGTATITDGDGDKASETVSLDLGGNVRFADDGPTIDAMVTDANTVLVTTHDALTIGAASDTAASTANFGGAFSIASSSYGADGAGTTVWAYALNVTAASSGLASDGAAINLYLIGGQVVGSTSGTVGGVGAANTIFTIGVNATTGVVTLTQFAEIDHAPNNDTSAPYDDQFAILGTGLVTLSGTATITDGDGDKASETVILDLGGNVRFADDGPSIDASVTDANTVLLTTKDALTIGPASDSAVSTANFGGAFSIASSSYGADGPGTTAWTYALAVTNAVSGLSSGGAAISLYLIAGQVVGSTAALAANVSAANTIFTLGANSTTGVVTLTQFAQIDHVPNNDSSAPYDDQFAILNTGLVTLSGTATITDGDGDKASETVVLDLGGNVRFADDGPAVISSGNITLTGNSLSGSAAFNYTTGADAHNSYSALSTDFAVALSGKVGSTAIASPTVTWASETSTSATFNFAFQYDSDPTSSSNPLTSETGTIVFDKVAHTYTVTLDQPIATYAVATTSSTISSTGYDLAGSPQPEVVVSLLANSPSLYVQFSGFEVTGGGGGTPLTAGGNTAYANGETFSAAQTFVSISGTANGVASDTIQNGEVLDFDFFTSNPGSNTGLAPTASATGMYLKLDGFGNEDLVVVLKLADPNNPGVVLTTKAIIVDNGDVYTQATGVPAGYNVTLDSNDGLIIIESNDYNAPGQNYVIVGAQLLSSTGGITGTGVDLNKAVGAAGGSTGTEAFGAITNDNDVVKISDIGLTRLTTSTQTAHLDFDVTIKDADGDTTGTTRLSVNPVAPPVAIDLDGNGLQFIDQAAGMRFDYNGDGIKESTAWVDSHDGILAIDRNGDGIVNDGSEIVFATAANGAATDLEGLRIDYDTNHDGILSAADADFAKFGVWQDADGNGVADPGEFKSLGALGIVSLDLTSDSKSYTAANGQVTVFGEASYTRTDGTTGITGDVAFATKTAESDRLAVQSTTSSGLSSALLAASLITTAATTVEESPTIAPATTDTTVLPVSDATATPVATDIQVTAPTGEVKEAVSEPSTQEATTSLLDHSTHTDPAPASSSIDGGTANDTGPAPSDLLASTDQVHAAPPAPAPMFVDMAAIPVVQAAAAIANAPAPAAATDHAQQVAAVLADTLAGGAGHGPDISALFASLPAPAPAAPAEAAAPVVADAHAEVAIMVPGVGEFHFDMTAMAHDAVTATVHA